MEIEQEQNKTAYLPFQIIYDHLKQIFNGNMCWLFTPHPYIFHILRYCYTKSQQILFAITGFDLM